jgi:flagellar basal body-associated protein FliL|tara:strand:- start:16218 stop:16367 length:150 start_codon:yes stop_codon:yes gene_type:complete
MKSFFLFLIALIVLVAVVGGGGLIFYLSKTSEITRVEKTPPPSSPVPGQ